MALRLLRRLQQKLGARPWLGVGEGQQGRRGTTGSLTGEREEAAPAWVSSAGDARWRRELRWRRGAGRLRRCGRRTEQGGDDGCWKETRGLRLRMSVLRSLSVAEERRRGRAEGAYRRGSRRNSPSGARGEFPLLGSCALGRAGGGSSAAPGWIGRNFEEGKVVAADLERGRSRGRGGWREWRRQRKDGWDKPPKN